MTKRCNPHPLHATRCTRGTRGCDADHDDRRSAEATTLDDESARIALQTIAFASRPGEDSSQRDRLKYIHGVANHALRHGRERATPVFVVTRIEYDAIEVHSVFSTREQAEAYCEAQKKTGSPYQWLVREHTIDAMLIGKVRR